MVLGPWQEFREPDIVFNPLSLFGATTWYSRKYFGFFWGNSVVWQETVFEIKKICIQILAESYYILTVFTNYLISMKVI